MLGRKLKDNFTGSRQRNLQRQAQKHRIQGALVTIVVILGGLMAAIYFFLPKAEEMMRQSIIDEQVEQKVSVLFTTNDVLPREHLKDNVISQMISRELVPDDALVINDLSVDYILKRPLKNNEILTKDDVISLEDLVPDARRYQEYDGVIDVPTGIDQYEHKEMIVVDVRYLNLDQERNEVVLSKKELPLLIGTTIWLQLEDERERKLMDSAIKEKEMEGGSLILSIYTDPEIQEGAEITYVPKDERGNEEELTESRLEKVEGGANEKSLE